jgi:hypothetical protein
VDDSLRQWCAERLGSPVVSVLAKAGNLSRVFTVALGDGRSVVVKTRPWQDRLVACSAVQSFVAERGFPCARPLVAAERLFGEAVSVEEDLPGGQQLSLDSKAAKRFASLLARLIAIQVEVPELAVLHPSPPWVGWDHGGQTLWPPRDTPGPALDAVRGPAWVDDAGAAARSLLTAVRMPTRLGHGDWESQNLRWINGVPHAVHDWDSAIAQPEPAIVGAAAAVWPAGHNGRHAATVDESHAFIAAYEASTRVPWDRATIRVAWAAGLWVRAFNAKKDAADGGGPQLDLLTQEVAERRQLAGL